MSRKADPRGWVALFALYLTACGSSPEGIAGDAGASACGTCHTTQYAAWSTSGLASTGTSPVFRALAASAATAWGQPAATRCVGCHQPGFGGDHGIGCVSCHSATGNLDDRDGLLTVDLSKPVSGPFDDPLPTPAHGSQTYGLLTSPVLCGTCHEVTGPGLFHETTLSEYEGSRAPSDGIVCATCHMPPLAPGPIADGQTNQRTRSDHSFVGFDPPWGASAAQQADAASRTLELLQSGLTLTATYGADGGDLQIAVTNNAGHAVPTGVTFLRSIWVDVEFQGAGASMTIPSVIVLGSQPTLAGAPVALITQADSVQPRELAAGATVSAQVATPPSLTPPVQVVVTLQARAVRPEVLTALGLSSLQAEVPTHEVAVVRLPNGP